MLKFLGILLGAGAGTLGTVIRVLLAGIGGWLISKGVDVGTANSITESVIGLATLILSAVGSFLNNQTK